MEYNNNGLLNISSLTPREAKGYAFEVDVQNMLSNIGYCYVGNPISPIVWKSNNKHKIDIELYNGLRIECKDIDGKVFRSWYIRDWKNKGNCVFTYRGDLKLSQSIYSEFHPIVFHYFLLPIYLKYNIRLFRNTVTSLYQATNNYINTKANTDVEEDNLLGKSEAKESNSRVFSENSMEKTKGDSKSKVNEHRNNYDINDETMFKPIEPKKKYPPRSFWMCYRCGKTYAKQTAKNRYFCNNCLSYAKNEIDRQRHLWYYTKTFYEKRLGIVIRCQLCGKVIDTLEPVVSVGQRIRVWYHASCWEKLTGIEDSEPKETITVLFNGKEITEII